MKKIISFFIFLIPLLGISQFQNLIPENTATHIAVKNGKWSDSTTWSSGQGVPGLASIVFIPEGITVQYDLNSSEHVFAIRVDGGFVIRQPFTPIKLVVDSFMAGKNSSFRIWAGKPEHSTVEIVLKAFNINKKKNGQIAGAQWNSIAKNHYTDGNIVKDHFGKNLPSDGPGVLGRYKWDPKQATLALMSHGQVRINGQKKLSFSECSNNISKGANSISLKETPSGWKVGDQILVAGTKNKGESEIFAIKAISGNTITLNKKTKYSHQGVNLSGTDYFTYTGNLTRNVIIRSDHTSTQNNPTRRGHVMFMFNGDVRVQNAQFKDLGRTDKSNMLDDLKIGIPKVITNQDGRKDVRLPNFKNELETNPSLIENQRGRYALHFHKTLRGANSEQMVLAKGNVVWGSPGWGMVHHDSHADFSDNVILDIEGGGMVAESGSETGIWQHNFVTGEKNDITVPFINNERFSAPMKRYLRNIIDDDFKLPEAYCLQGRAVEMVDNVAAAIQIGFNYQGNGDRVLVADKVNTSIYEASGKANPFPFDEEITRTLAPFIRFENNVVFNAQQTFKSQTRNKSGAYHRVNSVIDNLVGWNIYTFGIYISSNFGYLINNSKIHSVNTNSSNNTPLLIHIGNDNLSFNNTNFYNWKKRGVVVNESDSKAQFIFNKVNWINSPKNYKPYKNDPKNIIKVMNKEVDPSYKVSFRKANNMDDLIDLNKNDFKFNIRGKVTDQGGTNDFGNRSPRNNTADLVRHYTFKNKQNIINKFLKGRKSFTDGRGTYINFTEYISNRISTAAPSAVPIKIYVKGYNFNAATAKTQELTDHLKLYPNPTKTAITVVNEDDSYLERVLIYDITGKTLYDKHLSKENINSLHINLKGYPAGIYFLKTKNTIKKFVITD
ncbi:T9SS type A sorting domain-containing protein [Tenacibaculum sp. M341]|uniref:T9SS type A sorting domain-containing protein n=1 Tax=Tenacibaculum sp. M341 TaxID=2530339 RepID=UPI001043D20B|nr:T9SS type A sorting domain-containing protein [Tenacibaculum sp. M341]TCI93753.1 T9SS type A sorting domain-containing protein [Tenacibaculum sp. M341]